MREIIHTDSKQSHRPHYKDWRQVLPTSMFLAPHVFTTNDAALRYERLQIRVLRPTTQATPSERCRERSTQRSWPRHWKKPDAGSEIANNIMLRLQFERGFRDRFLDNPVTWSSSATKANKEGISENDLRDIMYSYTFMFLLVLFLADAGNRLDYWRTWRNVGFLRNGSKPEGEQL